MMCTMHMLALLTVLILVACNDAKPAPTPAPGADTPAAPSPPSAPPSRSATAPAEARAAAPAATAPAEARAAAPAATAPAEAQATAPAAPAATADAPEPAADEAVRGEVDLELSGAVTGTFRGPGATCSRFEIEGTPSATIKVMSRDLGAAQDWDLTFMVTTEDEWETPAVILNARGATRASYTYGKQEPAGESVSVARDLTGATIDLSLKELVGKRKVRVKGTIRCPG
jgi:hypothetical protein